MNLHVSAQSHEPSSPPAAAMISIAREIWERKYRFKNAEGVAEGCIEESWTRIARAVAAAESGEGEQARWERRFYDALAGFAFIPAGRILSGAGTGRDVTLFNCFVMGRIEDSMESIFAHVREAALTMQQGGGIGHDFSVIRPKGALVRGVGAEASGPVSFMDVWDAMCKTIMSAGARRGAMMGTLRCDHPDIEAFIEAKSDRTRLRNFNISVLVTDAFMEAVLGGKPWPLSFEGTVHKMADAKELWQKIMQSAYDYAEPGVIFIDRVNALNNLSYCETIAATNPCGEEPLPPYGACLLGSLNLAALVESPFGPDACIPDSIIDALVPVAVRFLDNVIDISKFPLAAQEQEAKAKRRLGLGVTGLANALILCGKHYGTEAGRIQAERWMARIARAAYLASAGLAKEKGAFPLFDRERFLDRPFVKGLDREVREAIAAGGMRNGLLLAIAPTGTISLLAGNVSGGIEPVFDREYQRQVTEPDGSRRPAIVQDYAYRRFRELKGDCPLPDYFVTAHDLSPEQHVLMQAALQRHIDASISKTVNCPADLPFESFAGLYREAYRLGAKGCTAYRPNQVTGEVLKKLEPQPAALPAPLPAAEIMPALAPRDPVLGGYTYKTRWPGSDHAIYITVNDIVDGGKRLPYEVFINSKALEHYAWTVALTRLISAIFRRGGDVAFVTEELKAVFDPRGGGWSKGLYLPSVPALIGVTIEEHFRNIGYLPPLEGKPMKGAA
jgi:ribonucleoside-diphosphate reductase alpha chain